MKNDFTDLHNEFRDNLKKINQQQLDENFVQLEQQLDEINVRDAARNLGAGVSRGAGRMVDAAGRGIKSLPKGRIDLGKMLLNPGQYARDYDPEKMLNKGVSKLGYRLQSGISGVAAYIGNAIFGRKEKKYKKYVLRSINKSRERLEGQRKLMQRLRTLTAPKMAELLGGALFEYLVERRYSVIIRLADETERPNNTNNNQNKEQQNNTDNNQNKEQQTEAKEANFSQDILNEIDQPTANNNKFFSQWDREVKDREDKLLDRDDTRRKPLDPASSKKLDIEKKKRDYADDIIKKNKNNIRNAIQLYIANIENIQLDKDKKSNRAIAYHAMEFCVGRVFEKLLGKYFFSEFNPVIEYDPGLKPEYNKYNNDPTVFFPSWLIYVQQGLNPEYKKLVKDREDEADEKTQKDADKLINRKEKEKQTQKEQYSFQTLFDDLLFEKMSSERESEIDAKIKSELGDANRNKKQPESESEEYTKDDELGKLLRKRLTLQNMIDFAVKLRNFRTIATFVNYDNIMRDIEYQLQQLKTREIGAKGGKQGNFFRTPLQKIDAVLGSLTSEIKSRDMKLNQMKRAFANWDDEDKKQHEKAYRDEFTVIQNERNEMLKKYKAIKARRTEFLNGQDMTQDELAALDDKNSSFEFTKKDEKETEKETEKKEEEEISMPAFRDLLDVVRASAYDGRLDMNAVQAAEIMATKVSNKTGKKLADLTQMLQQAKDAKPEKTQTDSYEFQMKDFDYLAEKFIQKESSPLLESMPMIRFRRNPREGTSKIVMVCGKDEFKKSLNKTINVAGKKVKDVMCLPKQLKSAKERLKDRKASIKRWRKIRVNSVTVERMNRKKQETKKASRTLRK